MSIDRDVSQLITSQQQGVGLVEVLIALLLLATVALGYSALQARSYHLMMDANMRSKALLILNETAQRMRTNSALTDYAIYQSYIMADALPVWRDCLAVSGCTPQQVAKNDVYSLRKYADSQGITLAMVTCPGTADQANTRCLVATWYETSVSGDATGSQCFNSQGVYYVDADCLYIEAY